ncbi:MAG: MoaD/ThiS family protein [Rhodococcus sp.]|nr:MoaD/ThiS family protein [Rhodococcus sp. (in: high G+C Gram-positive bacteria)]
MGWTRTDSHPHNEAWERSVADVGHDNQVDIQVRYFAAAADAARSTTETVRLPVGATLGDVAVELERRHGEAMAKVLKVSAFLVGLELTRDLTTPASSQVDLLPPFAGG